MKNAIIIKTNRLLLKVFI